MHSLRPPAIIAAFLIIAFSITPSLFSQPAPKPSQPKQPAPRAEKSDAARRAFGIVPPPEQVGRVRHAIRDRR